MRPLIWKCLGHLAFAAMTFFYLEWRNPSPDLAAMISDEIIRKVDRAVQEKMLDRAQEIARRNGHRWTDQELSDIGAVFEKWDLPVELGVAIRKWENGGISYPMGVSRLHRAILATSLPRYRQPEGAARLCSRAAFWMLLEREDIYHRFKEVHGTRAEPEKLIRMYPTPYSHFLLEEVWKPRNNRAGMKDFIREALKEGGSE